MRCRVSAGIPHLLGTMSTGILLWTPEFSGLLLAVRFPTTFPLGRNVSFVQCCLSPGPKSAEREKGKERETEREKERERERERERARLAWCPSGGRVHKLLHKPSLMMMSLSQHL